jgi:hypothetical protein
VSTQFSKVPRACRQCGRQFFPGLPSLSRGEGIFCSSACCGVSRRTPAKNCARCSTPFVPDKKSQRFCSRSCGAGGILADLTRFFSNYRVNEVGCWIWQGLTNRKTGYAVVSGGHVRDTKTKYLHKQNYVHAVAWEVTHRIEVPDDHILLHECQTPTCINPSHLTLTVRRTAMHAAANYPRNPFAINARKTHCIRGHELTGDNVYTPPKAPPHYRTCRACRRLYPSTRSRKNSIRLSFVRTYPTLDTLPPRDESWSVSGRQLQG